VARPSCAVASPCPTDVASPLASPDDVQSRGEGLKDYSLGASPVSSCSPGAGRGVLGGRALLHPWDEATEGPVGCWGGGLSSRSHSLALILPMGSRRGKHLKINVRANRPSHLPLIKPQSAKQHVGVCRRRRARGAHAVPGLRSKRHVACVSLSGCGRMPPLRHHGPESWHEPTFAGAQRARGPLNSQHPGGIWLLNPIMFAD